MCRSKVINFGRASTKTALVVAFAVMGGTPSAARATLDVLVRHVGLPTIGERHVVRGGGWTPVIVDIGLQEGDEANFDGYLKITQLDNDGDVCYDTVEVHLLGGLTPPDSRRYYLYTLPNPVRAQETYAVEVYDTEGEIVEVLSDGELTTRATVKQPPVAISDDHLFILSIGSGAIGRISDLAGPEQHEMLARPVHVGHMNASDLPNLWIGLEAIDCIIWDNADPNALSLEQMEALIEWIRQGGTLLIAGARTSGLIAQSAELSAVLPVTLGDTFSTNQFAELRNKLLGVRKRETGPYPRKLEAVRVQVKQGARIIHREEVEPEEDVFLDVITRHRVGRGQVVFSAVALSDLFSAGQGSPALFFRRVLFLREPEPGELEAMPDSIYNYVMSVVAFSTSGSLYLVIAVLFSIAYVGLATFGAWGFLSAKRWKHHNWSAFALIAVAASLLSIGAVRSVQGVKDKLHQLTIVDLKAGETYGYATALFGVKTTSDIRLDFWLPSDHLGETEPGESNCVLRPMPDSIAPEQVGLPYPDPVEYKLVPGNAEIHNLRVRGTLKLLEGRWEGLQPGTIRGFADVRSYGRLDWRFTKDSYISNELGVDLHNCWIVHAVVDSYAQDGLHIMGDRGKDAIYAYPIGEVPAGGVKRFLRDLCYQPVAGDETIEDIMQRCKLGNIQSQNWSRPFRGLLRGVVGEQEEAALMLLSTMGEYNCMANKSQMDLYPGEKTFSRDRLRQLDLHEQLQRDCVYFIGFADDSGPVRLQYRRHGRSDYRTLNPEEDQSKTMYRVRIPLKVQTRDEARRLRQAEEGTESESIAKDQETDEVP